MEDDRMFSFTLYSVFDQMNLGYKLLSWYDVMIQYTIGELLYPYSIDEIDAIYINGARFGHTALNSEGIISTQLALIPLIRNEVVIHIRVHMDDPRNDELFGEEEEGYEESTICSDPPPPQHHCS